MSDKVSFKLTQYSSKCLFKLEIWYWNITHDKGQKCWAVDVSNGVSFYQWTISFIHLISINISIVLLKSLHRESFFEDLNFCFRIQNFLCFFVWFEKGLLFFKLNRKQIFFCWMFNKVWLTFRYILLDRVWYNLQDLVLVNYLPRRMHQDQYRHKRNLSRIESTHLLHILSPKVKDSEFSNLFRQL